MERESERGVGHNWDSSLLPSRGVFEIKEVNDKRRLKEREIIKS